MTQSKPIPAEDGTITDHELKRVITNYIIEDPEVPKSTVFAHAFRLGQQFPHPPSPSVSVG